MSPKLRKVILRQYPPEEARTAIRLLENDPILIGGTPSDRVQCAAVKLSGGSLGTLERVWKQAKVDWRDTLMAAGFGYDAKAHLEWLDRL